MRELIRTNDIVLLSFIRALMDEAGLFLHVADEAMSSVEGSIGILPRRVLVRADEEEQARLILTQAGIDPASLSGHPS